MMTKAEWKIWKSSTNSFFNRFSSRIDRRPIKRNEIRDKKWLFISDTHKKFYTLSMPHIYFFLPMNAKSLLSYKFLSVHAFVCYFLKSYTNTHTNNLLPSSFTRFASYYSQSATNMSCTDCINGIKLNLIFHSFPIIHRSYTYIQTTFYYA